MEIQNSIFPQQNNRRRSLFNRIISFIASLGNINIRIISLRNDQNLNHIIT